MAGTIKWNPQPALNLYRGKLIRGVERASAEGADHARELAPLGKGAHQATGSNPRFFSTRLQTTYEFKREHKTKHAKATVHALARLNQLRSLNRRDLVGLASIKPSEGGLQTSDIEYFRINQGSHKGEKPDIIDVQPAKGPGGEAVKGAVTTYRPGRLRRGIHPLEPKVKGLRVTGGYVSEAPYSVYVEKGFHHKGGTEVEPVHFMRKSAEALRERWNSGEFIKE